MGTHLGLVLAADDNNDEDGDDGLVLFVVLPNIYLQAPRDLLTPPLL